MPPDPPHLDAADPLRGLRSEHPRLILTHADVETLRRRERDEPDTASLAAVLRKRAVKLLPAPPATYDIPDGRRLLATSRLVVDRIQTLALFAMLDDDRRFADRAWQELEAVAAFPDWNPSHFLDAAELANAFGLGFDWLHRFLDESQQVALADAIVKHALIPATSHYEKGGWWSRGDNNWNVVCHGGLGVAALAIADRQPDLARRVLREAIEGMPYCLRHFAPDGGWPEGTGYWVYTHDYLTYFLAACETALGHDFGLSDLPGLDRSSLFVVHLASPTGNSFNFSDSSDRGVYTPALLYHARRFNVPAAAAYQLQRPKPRPFDLVWHPESHPADAITPPPLDYYCRGVECVTMRSAWNEKSASFFAIQCGANTIGHNRLDKGAFIYESRGVRWFVSLPADDYNQPGFFGKLRYDYYRNRAEGHNALVVNPCQTPDQTPTHGGTVTLYESTDNGVRAALDLSPCYPWAGGVHRHIDYSRTRGVTLTDDLESRAGATMESWWFAHTRCRVEVDGSGHHAMLYDDESGQSLRIDLVEPARARFMLMPAHPLPSSPNPEGQNPNDGTYGEGIRRVVNGPPVPLETPDPKLAVRKLALYVQGESKARLVVRFGP